MSVFALAETADVALMVLGLVGSFGDSVSAPVMLLIISRIFNDFGNSDLVQGFSSKINEVRTHARIKNEPATWHNHNLLT